MRSLFATFALFAQIASAQYTFPSTTLSGPMNLYSPEVPLASYAALQGPGFPAPSGGIGQPNPVTASTEYILLVEQEAICVLGVWGNTISASRGCESTITQGHVQASKVWVGPAYFYHPLDPTAYQGGFACVAAQQYVLPWITLPSGNIWDCTGNLWVLRAPTLKRPHVHVPFWKKLKGWLEKTY